MKKDYYQIYSKENNYTIVTIYAESSSLYGYFYYLSEYVRFSYLPIGKNYKNFIMHYENYKL